MNNKTPWLLGKKFQSLVNEYSEQQWKFKEQVVSRFKVYAGERASQNQEEKIKEIKIPSKAYVKKLISTPAQVGDRGKLIGSRQPIEIVEIKNQYLLSIGALSTWVTRDKFIPAESLHGDKGTIKGKARGGVQMLILITANENSTKPNQEVAENKKLKKRKTVEKETKTGKKRAETGKKQAKRKSVANCNNNKEKLKEASEGPL